jgi:hypothetical protein
VFNTSGKIIIFLYKMELRINRILKNTDMLINKYYEYNEENILPLAKKYIYNYIDITKTDNLKHKDLICLCNVCYLIAVKFLLDECPTMSDYSNITSIDKKSLIEKEFDVSISLNFKFNICI